MPGLAVLIASVAAALTSSIASQAYPATGLADPLPHFASYFEMKSSETALTGFESGNSVAATTGPVGRSAPSPALPAASMKAFTTAPCVW